MQRGMAIGEALQLLVSFCDNDIADWAVRTRAVVESWHWLRAVKRLANGGRANGCRIPVSRLSTVLKSITNNESSGRSFVSAVATAVASQVT